MATIATLIEIPAVHLKAQGVLPVAANLPGINERRALQLTLKCSKLPRWVCCSLENSRPFARQLGKGKSDSRFGSKCVHGALGVHDHQAADATMVLVSHVKGNIVHAGDFCL